MTNAENYFAMYTQEGNDEVARVAEQFLADCLIVAESISHVVHTWERYAKSEHPDFCAKHGEYSDTAVRDVLYSFFAKRLGERKYTNATPENTPLLRS